MGRCVPGPCSSRVLAPGTINNPCVIPALDQVQDSSGNHCQEDAQTLTPHVSLARSPGLDHGAVSLRPGRAGWDHGACHIPGTGCTHRSSLWELIPSPSLQVAPPGPGPLQPQHSPIWTPHARVLLLEETLISPIAGEFTLNLVVDKTHGVGGKGPCRENSSFATPLVYFNLEAAGRW